MVVLKSTFMVCLRYINKLTFKDLGIMTLKAEWDMTTERSPGTFIKWRYTKVYPKVSGLSRLQ